MLKMNLQLFGGRGASSGGGGTIPDGGVPGGGGGGGNIEFDAQPGMTKSLQEALGKKGRPMSAYNAVTGTNPFYDRQYGEYTQNCQRCTAAFEARRRGYDVIALPTYKGDTAPKGDGYKSYFKNAKTDSVSGTTPNAMAKSVDSQMKGYGEGSRAMLVVGWKGRGADGHVINVEHRNGKTYYYDGQTGKQYKGQNFFTNVKRGTAGLTRVDNLEFSNKANEAFRPTPKR